MSADLDLSAAEWVKSSYSGGNGGDCVEFSRSFAPLVPVRDSKSADGPALVFTPAHWRDFVSALNDGDLHTR